MQEVLVSKDHIREDPVYRENMEGVIKQIGQKFIPVLPDKRPDESINSLVEVFGAPHPPLVHLRRLRLYKARCDGPLEMAARLWPFLCHRHSPQRL